VKIGVSADWHVDNISKTYLIDGIPNREIDLGKQVNEMVRVCKQKNVKTFTIAGDLFDKNAVTGYYFNKVVDYLEMFTDNDIEVVIIQGNHETKESGIPLTNTLGRLRNKNIWVFDSITKFPAKDATIYLVPHIRRELFKQYKNYTEYVKDTIFKYKEKGKSIIIGHFQPTLAVPGSEQEMFAGSTRFVDCSIFKNALVVCGHVHKPQEMGRVIIPGSPVRFNKSERSEIKRFVIYDTVTNKLESAELNCQKMSLIKVDLFNKSVINFPKERIMKYKDALLYIDVISSKKNRYKVNSREIVSVFEDIGAKVVSFKVDLVGESGKLEKSVGRKSMTPNSVFNRMLTQIVKKEEEKKRIGNMGRKVMEEVSD